MFIIVQLSFHINVLLDEVPKFGREVFFILIINFSEVIEKYIYVLMSGKFHYYFYLMFLFVFVCVICISNCFLYFIVVYNGVFIGNFPQ